VSDQSVALPLGSYKKVPCLRGVNTTSLTLPASPAAAGVCARARAREADDPRRAGAAMVGNPLKHGPLYTREARWGA